MRIDGSDDRGIDVGILTTDSHDVIAIRSHVDDVDDEGLIFSRDCAEYHVRANDQGDVIIVMVNHFKSKGYSTPDDKLGAKRRGRQAKGVAEIYKQRTQDGFTNIAVVGDFNDSPESAALDALLVGTDLRGWEGSPTDVSQLDDSYAEGDMITLLVSRDMSDLLRDVLLIDDACEFLVARAEGSSAGVILVGSASAFEERIEYVLSEANAETNQSRERRLDEVCDSLEAALAG
jgi:Endonuclease/Exonuclease/phosphatase family